jgi:hypothetical protein
MRFVRLSTLFLWAGRFMVHLRHLFSASTLILIIRILITRIALSQTALMSAKQLI